MASGAMAEAQSQRGASQRLLVVALWLLLMILATKVWIGFATRSLSLLAAALHTLVTILSLVFSLSAIAATKRGTREIWGHGRLEASLTVLVATFLGMIACVLVGFIGAQMTWFASPLLPPVAIDLPLVQLVGGMTTLTLLLGMVGRYQGQLWQSASLKFSFRQSLQDAGLMVAIVGGLFGCFWGFSWLDPWLALLALGITLMDGWQVVNQQLPSMMQQVAIAPEALAAITHQVEGILHCYGIRSRGMVGRLVMVELRLILHPECTDLATAIARRIERLIIQHYGPAKVHIYFDGPLTKTPGDRPTS